MRAPVEPNAAIELHDSKLDRIEFDGDGLLAVLTAYVHRSYGVPGESSGTGWLQEAHFRLEHARTEGILDTLPLELLGGWLQVAGSRFDNCIPVPFSSSALVTLCLNGHGSHLITLQGDSVRIALVGVGQYVEDFNL